MTSSPRSGSCRGGQPGPGLRRGPERLPPEPPSSTPGPEDRHAMSGAPARARTEPAGDLLVADRLHEALRWPGRGERHRFPDPARLDRQPDRPERRRQDDFFNMITGLYIPTEGAIVFDGDRASPASSRTRSSALGIARTFQNIRLFGNMTARWRTCWSASTQRAQGPLFGTILRTPRRHARRSEARKRARWSCSSSSGWRARDGDAGPQPAVWRSAPPRDRARAGDRPKLLLLDEPTAGHEPRGDRRADGVRPRAARPRSG